MFDGEDALGQHTGRWDYINSVSDAMAWDETFVNPNIDAVTMTYGYMRQYEDRVRRAVNTPDRNGQCALWQGGMEPNIPIGSAAGVESGMKRAVAGGEREQQAGLPSVAIQYGNAFGQDFQAVALKPADSKVTTLPIAREIVVTYVTEPFKAPWYIDLLNINLDNYDLEAARRRVSAYMTACRSDGTRITNNLVFDAPAHAVARS